MSTKTPFRILTVCTDNICRSPMAERLLQAGFDGMAPGEFTVASAGTGAWWAPASNRTWPGS